MARGCALIGVDGDLMGSEILRPEDENPPPAAMPEVEFALVLSRMIESVKNDPEHLRQTVYELARHKLQEQLASESGGERRQLSRALETAIHGVETFVKNNDEEPVAYALPELPTPKALEAEGERFRPYRTVAAWYCWRAVDLAMEERKA